jgi:hypothetical protein
MTGTALASGQVDLSMQFIGPSILQVDAGNYNHWRDYDPEDTVRFHALRLHEAGMILKD